MRAKASFKLRSHSASRSEHLRSRSVSRSALSTRAYTGEHYYSLRTQTTTVAPTGLLVLGIMFFYNLPPLKGLLINYPLHINVQHQKLSPLYPNTSNLITLTSMISPIFVLCFLQLTKLKQN